MLLTHIYWIFLIWLITGILGLISMPICRLIFKSASDKGYAFSKIVGWLAISYLAFVLATLKIFQLPLPALAAAFLLWLAFNSFLFLKKRENIFPNLKSVIVVEAIFLLAFSGIILIKSWQPEIYQIERFMDFGFIESLRNSVSLPAQDIWLSGHTLNYYYFGHFIGFIVLSLTGINTVPGFYLLTALIFALLACSVYRLGADMAERAGPIAGLVSIFSVLIAGTWYMVPKLFKGMASFFYPEPTRVIVGTITEMPIYSFIVAELHAHVWGLISGILVLAILYSIWRGQSPRVFGPPFFGLVFVLGMAFMINSWDALTLGFLSAAVLFVKYRWDMRLLLLPPAAFLISLPWAFFNKAPVTSAGFIFFPSAFGHWFSFWGSVIMVPIIYFILRIGRERFSTQIERETFSTSKFPGVVMLSGIFFLILMELAYAKDVLSQGEWYRANTVFKLTLQVWLWLNIFAGPLFVWLYFSFKKRLAKVICVSFLAIYLFVGSIYPVIAVKQSSLQGKKFTGIDHGLDWWKNKYPDDYEAYLFLKNLKDSLSQSEKIKIIVEAEGDSYTDISRFSVFLGWPTVVGWPVHEWTWRGSYDEVGKRRTDVIKIYTGSDAEEARALLNYYNVDYIIVGQIEKQRYDELLRTEKLRGLGNVIFERGQTFIIEL